MTAGTHTFFGDKLDDKTCLPDLSCAVCGLFIIVFFFLHKLFGNENIKFATFRRHSFVHNRCNRHLPRVVLLFLRGFLKVIFSKFRTSQYCDRLEVFLV